MPLKHEQMLNQKIKTFSFYNVLGSGAFARVYQAVDERDNSQVAIKAIPKQLMRETPKLEELVKTEIKVLKQCKNENVIRYIDSFTSDRTVFIAMEFCNGGDLEQYHTEKKRLTEDEATNFLKQILNGFRGLHEVGAMHRDFKLANVLLHNGVCKIADLGFAKQMQQGRSITTTILGTSLTMAPEVLAEKPYGMEADLWSIGVVYYQMIYGKYPYQGLNDYDILKKIKNTRPDYSAVKISSECRDFIDRCLTVEPRGRIKWSEVYSHPLLTKSEGKFLFGVKSKISMGSNKNYYEEHKFPEENNNLINPNMANMQKKGADIEWEHGGDIRQSINLDKLKEEANLRMQRDLTFGKHEKKYLEKRNSIMFIFKYVCPCVNTLVKFKANHGIALFITSKKAFIDMKQFLAAMRAKENLFGLTEFWKEFVDSNNYVNLLKIFEADCDMIEAQALSYKFDIEIQSKEIEAEGNIHHVSTKNWQQLVNDTVNEYWFLLAESMTHCHSDDKETLIRVLEALDFYRESKIVNIEEFAKIMEVLDIKETENKIRAKYKSIFD